METKKTRKNVLGRILDFPFTEEQTPKGYS